MRKLGFFPLEERIVLDAAAAPTVAAAAAAQSAAPTASPAAPPSDGIHVLVIPININYVAALEGAAKAGVIVVGYDPAHETLAQLSNDITQALGGKEAASIGFVEQGNAGTFTLLNSLNVNINSLNSETNGLAQFWHQVADNLQSNGQLDIIACNVGKGAAGQEFVQVLSEIVNDHGSSITVNAATSLVGSTSLGGSWILQSPNAVDVASVYFDSSELSTWNHTLDTTASISFSNESITLVGGGPITGLYPGAAVEYSVTITNTGTEALTGSYGVFFDTNYNFGYTGIGASSSNGDQILGGAFGTAQSIIFEVSSLAVGATDTITFQATVGSGVTYGTILSGTNIVVNLTGQTDNQEVNQQYNFTEQPSANPTLTITPTYTQGNPLYLTSGNTPDLTFTVSLPGAFQQNLVFPFISFLSGGAEGTFLTNTGAIAYQGIYENSSGPVTIFIGAGSSTGSFTIPSYYNAANTADSYSLGIQVDNNGVSVNGGPPLSNGNNASITTTYFENLGIYTDESITPVSGATDISQLYPGSIIEYSITFINNVNEIIFGSYTINLDGSLSYVSGTGNQSGAVGGTVSGSGQTVTFDLGAGLAPGASNVITLQAIVNSGVNWGDTFSGTNLSANYQISSTYQDTYNFVETPQSFATVILTAADLNGNPVTQNNPLAVYSTTTPDIYLLASWAPGVTFANDVDFGNAQLIGGTAVGPNYLNAQGNQAYSAQDLSNVTILANTNSTLINIVGTEYNPSNITNNFIATFIMQVNQTASNNGPVTATSYIMTTLPISVVGETTDTNPFASPGTAMVLDTLNMTYTLTNDSAFEVDNISLIIYTNTGGLSIETIGSPSQGSTSTPSAGSFTWTVGTLMAGGVATLTFQEIVNITAVNGIDLTGSSQISGSYDGSSLVSPIQYFGANNTISTFTPVPTVISVTTIPSGNSVDAGQTIGVNVQLSNYYFQEVDISYSTADGTAVAGTDYTAVSGTIPFFQNLTIGVTPSLNSSTFFPINISTNITASLSPTLDFTFTAQQPNGAANSTPVVDTITIVVQDVNSLILTSNTLTIDGNVQSGTPDVSDGDVLVYTLVFTNNGNTTLTPDFSALFVDPNVTLTSVVPSEGTYTPGSGVSVTGISLDPGETFTITISETINQDAPADTTINALSNPSNTGALTDATTSASASFQYAQVNVVDAILVVGTVISSPLNTTANYTPPVNLLVPGNTLSYSFTVTNTGTDSFGSTVMTVAIDNIDLTINASSILINGAAAPLNSVVMTANGFTFTPPADITAGEVTTITFDAVVNSYSSSVVIGQATTIVTATDSDSGIGMQGSGDVAQFTTSLPVITITPVYNPTVVLEGAGNTTIEFTASITHAYNQPINYGSWIISGISGTFNDSNGNPFYTLNQVGGTLIFNLDQNGETPNSVTFSLPSVYFNSNNSSQVSLSIEANGVTGTGIIANQSLPTVTETTINLSNPLSTTAMIGNNLLTIITIHNDGPVALTNIHVELGLDSHTFNYNIFNPALGSASLFGNFISWDVSSLAAGATTSLFFSHKVYYNITDGVQIGNQTAQMGGTYSYLSVEQNSTNNTIETFTPIPTIIVANQNVTAGNSAVFQIQLSNPYWENVSLHYQTADGSAIAGINYQGVSGDLTFTSGTTTAGQTLLTIPGIQTNNLNGNSNLTFFVDVNRTSQLPTAVQIQATGTIQPVPASISDKAAPPSPWNHENPYIPSGTFATQNLMELPAAGFGGNFTNALHSFMNSQSHIDFTSYSLSGFVRESFAFGDPGIGLVPPTLTRNGDTIEGTFQLYLDTPPMDTVTIVITGSEGDVITPSTIQFTPDNWSIPQTVRFTENLKDAAAQPRGFIMQTTSGDFDYNGIYMPLITNPGSNPNLGVKDAAPDSIIGQLALDSISEFNHLSMAGSLEVVNY